MLLFPRRIQLVTPLVASILIAIVCTSHFRDQTLLYIMIFFGQAHFLITYIYTLKSGKMNSSYLKKALLLIGVSGLLCLFVTKHRELLYPFLVLITALLFVVHYIQDELKILNIPSSKCRALVLLAPLCTYTAAFTSKLLVASTQSLFILCGLAIVLLAVFIYYSLLQREKLELISITFLGLNTIIPGALAFTNAVSVGQLLAFIVLFHYTRWYIFYFQKLSREALGYYLETVVWVHVFIFLLFYQFMLAPFTGALNFFFNPIYFYGWTIVHILLSMRKSDYTTT